MKLAAPIALLCVFGLGICFSLVGAVKLDLAKELGISDVKVGGLISALMFTSLIVILLIGPLVDRFGHKPLAILGFFASAACIFVIAYAQSYTMALVACILLGVGAMCLNTVGNTLIPRVLFGGQNPPAALNLGNVAYGVGAFVTPLIVGLLVRKIGYSPAVNVIAVVVLLPILLAILGRDYPEVSTGFSAKQAAKLLASGAALVGGLALFCYISLEATMGGFITTYLTGESVAVKAETAPYILSAFWIALMVARLIASRLVTPARGVATIAALAAVSAAALGLMMVVTAPALGCIAVIIAGFAFGPIFPTIVGVTFGKFDPMVHGSVFGLIFAIGLLGGTTIPVAFGALIQRSPQTALLLLAGLAVLLIVFGLAMGAVRGTLAPAAKEEAQELPSE